MNRERGPEAELRLREMKRAANQLHGKKSEARRNLE